MANDDYMYFGIKDGVCVAAATKEIGEGSEKRNAKLVSGWVMRGFDIMTLSRGNPQAKVYFDEVCEVERKISETRILEKSKLFSIARPSAKSGMVGKDLVDATKRWFPALAGQMVRNTNDPDNGFDNRDLAVAAAHRYRASCRKFLAGKVGEMASGGR